MSTHDGDGTEPELSRLISGDEARRSLLDMAVAAAGIGTFDWDLTTGILTWDDRLLELFGYGPTEFDQTIEAFNDRLHPEDVGPVGVQMQKAIDGCGDYAAEFRVLLPDGGLRWVAARGRALCDEGNAAVRLLGSAWDITGRRAVQEQGEQAAARERLLSRITEDLAADLDAETAVGRLARLVIPAVADLAIVTLIGDDRAAGSRRGLRTSESWHANPELRPATEAYAQARLAALRDDALIVGALRTGQPQLLNGNATAQALSMVQPGPTRELLTTLAPEAVAVLPLPGRTGPVGMLTLANGLERGTFSPEDLVTMRIVASRAGLVLDNSRLYRQQRNLAEGFQRSLLTPPPEPDHLQIAVRYVPAGQSAQVGGDWYDALMQPAGATVLVIGDVVGHDVEAAAAMGQLRSIVRTLGAIDGDGPAAILRQADEVMQTLQSGILATVVVARLEQSAADRDLGVTRLRWSNAGHPAPAVIAPDGTVTLLTAGHTDLMLGVDPGTRRRDAQVTLDRGAVVILYSDGLIERRGSDLDHGAARLQAALADLAGHDLDELCDELLARMLPDQPDDDVALVAVRLHPQDRPRPPEAGPNRVPPTVPAD
ncbi:MULTISPECIES: SpoIIE family protein phosphatase [unclassified Blastococcus]